MHPSSILRSRKSAAASPRACRGATAALTAQLQVGRVMQQRNVRGRDGLPVGARRTSQSLRGLVQGSGVPRCCGIAAAVICTVKASYGILQHERHTSVGRGAHGRQQRGWSGARRFGDGERRIRVSTQQWRGRSKLRGHRVRCRRSTATATMCEPFSGGRL